MQTWKAVSEERFMEMLEILPPAVWTQKGFLVGEPWIHRACQVTGDVRAAYAPFLSVGGKYYEGSEPITGPEFKALDAFAAAREAVAP